MVDTVRPLATLLTLLADNTTKAITAQTARDVAVSVFAYASPMAFSFLAPANGTYVLDLTATEGYTINTLYAQLSAGSCTLAVQINGTNVTGLSAVAATTTLSTTNASAANTVTAGQKVTLVISSATGVTSATLDLKLTRTAA
jgi:hypothetical protein